jgi:outer membrane protein assembly factor BamD
MPIVDRISFSRIVVTALVVLGLSACAWMKEEIDETSGWSASKFYLEAKDALEGGNYLTAIGYFEKLQARYPFGRYAQQAQLELIYAYYKDDEPDAAIAAADRFIKMHPRHPFVDYAYYMKGLINFERGNTGALARILPSDQTQTDTDTSQQSLNDFAELVRKFPDSRYADDARQRILYLHNNLAAYEVHVAQYYLVRGAYVASANRAKYVLEAYARAPAVEDAVVVLVKAYHGMGLNDLARDSLRVLTLNYPNSPEAPELTALVNGEASKSSMFSLF